MKLGIILLLTTAVVAATACKTVRTPVPEPLPFPNVSLPRNFDNADPAPLLDKSSVVISILDPTYIWLGRKQYHLSDLEEIENAVKQAPQKIVYLRANENLEYASVIRAIDSVRRAGALEFALQVQMPGTAPDRQFVIKVTDRDPNAEFGKLNPALLGVILSADRKISLVKGGHEVGWVFGSDNKEDAGAVSDTSRLTQALTSALGGRTDRTVTIQAARATDYEDVVRIIDAVKGARANPIVLQIDDVP